MDSHITLLAEGAEKSLGMIGTALWAIAIALFLIALKI